MQVAECSSYEAIIESIECLNWSRLTRSDLQNIAVIYYYFSIQFRENLLAARGLHPDDEKLRELEDGECNTDNLSPWANVTQPGERVDHDEFMRRALTLSPIDDAQNRWLDAIGQNYLHTMRAMSPEARAQSIASYEDRGLERVFRAILAAPDWNNATLLAFRHFLVEHIKFDSDPEAGHGSLSRHLTPTDLVVPCWDGFRDMMVKAAPALLT